MYLRLGLPSHLSSLLPFLNNNSNKANKQKKQQKQVTEKFPE